jgi:galactosylxylosylprotein 3-beta-galactosyltransferase
MIHRFPVGVKGLDENELKRLQVEAEEYKDLLLIDKLADTFDNLARKTAYSIEAAVRAFEFQYVLKTDTDSFVRVGYMIKVGY